MARGSGVGPPGSLWRPPSRFLSAPETWLAPGHPKRRRLRRAAHREPGPNRPHRYPAAGLRHLSRQGAIGRFFRRGHPLYAHLNPAALVSRPCLAGPFRDLPIRSKSLKTMVLTMEDGGREIALARWFVGVA